MPTIRQLYDREMPVEHITLALDCASCKSAVGKRNLQERGDRASYISIEVYRTKYTSRSLPIRANQPAEYISRSAYISVWRPREQVSADA